MQSKVSYGIQNHRLFPGETENVLSIKEVGRTLKKIQYRKKNQEKYMH